MRIFSFALFMALVSNAANADLSISNNVISWPDDGWYQVQRSDTYEEVCGGGSSCEVPPGTYLVINHTTGQRYTDIFIASASNTLVVEGSTISWPDDGWYQVQTADTFVEVCAGGRSCDVAPGVYVVINHTTGERTEDIAVSNIEEAPQESGSRPTVNGNTISWTDDGWYQVQTVDTNEEICGGGRSCTVSPGMYNVINHSTGERFEGFVVAGPTVSGNVISWTDDGWHQVQTVGTHIEICGGGSSCEVEPGVYRVINHSTGERFEDVVVAAIANDSTATPEPEPAPDLNFSISSSGLATIEKTLTLKANSDDSLSEIVWGVESQPEGSFLQLAVSNSTHSVSLTPYEYGSYIVSGRDNVNGVERMYEFTVQEMFEYDLTQVENYEVGRDPSTFSGPILNQYWVNSESFGEEFLRGQLASFGDVRVLGFSRIQGLLIQIDDALLIDSVVSELRLTEGVDSLYPKMHIGRFSGVNDVDFSIPSLPNDYDGNSSTWDSTDDNWHLKSEGFGSNVLGAWALTKGHSNVGVAIIEPGIFWSTHEELAGRFYDHNMGSNGPLTWENRASIKDGNQLSPGDFAEASNHGTGVAAIVGARSNNGKGITGINQVSSLYLVAGLGDDDASGLLPEYLLSDRKVKVISSSWSHPQSADVDDAPGMGYGELLSNFDEAYYNTRRWRDFAKVSDVSNLLSRCYDGTAFECRSDILHVWSAGNEGIDSSRRNGALHYDKDKELSRLDNLVVVGAVDKNGVVDLNFGDSVDIYAPHEFKVPWLDSPAIDDNGNPDFKNNDYNDAFGGTSAAAPVVSGVASLIYSLAESKGLDVSAKFVKAVLVASASDSTVEINGNNEEIKLLNANSALMGASEIFNDYDYKVDVYASRAPAVAGESLSFIVQSPILPKNLVFELDQNSCPRNAISHVPRFECSSLSSETEELTFRLYAQVNSVQNRVLLQESKISVTLDRQPDISPKSIEAGKVQGFTVSGENLPDDFRVNLDGHSCAPVFTNRFVFCPYVESGGRSVKLTIVSSDGAILGLHYIRVDDPDIEGGTVPGNAESVIENVDREIEDEVTPRITSVSPRSVIVGESVEFTFVGDYLHTNTYVSLDGADDCSLSFQSSQRITVTCTPESEGQRNIILTDGNLGLPIPGSDAIVQVNERELLGPQVTQVRPLTATVGEEVIFEIFGSRLREITRIVLEGSYGGDSGGCDGIQSKSENKYTFRCVPETAGDQLLFIEHDDDVNVEGTPVVIAIAPAPLVQPKITSVSPLTATVGERTTFDIVGTDLPSTIWVNSDTQFISSTLAQVVWAPSVTGTFDFTVKKSINGLEISGSPVSITVEDAPVDLSPPVVSGVNPSTATVGQEVTFTVTGEYLPDSLSAFLTGAGYCDSEVVSESEVRFICIPVSAGQLNLMILTAPNASPALSLIEINISEAPSQDPAITSVSPTTVTVGEEVNFVLTGSNLPSTIAVSLEGTSNCVIESQSSSEVVVACAPQTAGSQSLYVAAESGGSAVTGTPLTVNVSPAPTPDPVISGISPQVATVGEEVDFVLTGSNLPSTIAVSLEGTSNCAIESKSSSEVVVVCTPQTAGSQSLYVAAESGGSAITGTPVTINVSPQAEPPFVSSVTPTTVIEGESVRFEISGSNFPEDVAVSIDSTNDCEWVSGSETRILVDCTIDTAERGRPIIRVRVGLNNANEGGAIFDDTSKPFVSDTGEFSGSPIIFVAIDVPVVSSVSPLVATVGEEVVFNISGTDLFNTSSVTLGESLSCFYVAESEYQVVARCVPDVAGIHSLTLEGGSVAVPVTSPLGVNVSPAPTPAPFISGVSPLEATIGEEVDFVLTGSNLPSTIAVSLEGTSNCAIESQSSSEVVVACTPQTAGSQSLYVAAESGGSAITGTPVAINVSPQAEPPFVSSVTPTTVTEGERVRFEIMGSNFPEDVAVAIWNTSDCAWVSGSESQLLVDCTINNVQPGRPIIRVMVGPNDVNAGGEIFYRDGQPFIANTEEFSGSPIIFVAIDLPVISSISPLVATVGEEVTFNISGTDLFNTTAVTLGESVSCSYVALSDFQVRAGCIPETAGVQSLTVDGGDIAASITSPFEIEVAEPVTAPVLSGGVNITDITGGFRINSQTATGTVDEYRFYRSTSAGSLGNRISAGNSNSYSDTGLADGTTYYYTIEACNDAGCDSSSQDFNTYVAPVIVPLVSSISPTQANEGEPTTFTIFGQGLSQENEVMFNTAGICGGSITAAADGSSIQVECLPTLEGARVVIVKEQPNGSIISGAELEVEVGPYILDPIIYSATPVSAIVGVATGFEITYRDAAFNLVLEGGICDNTSRSPGETTFVSIIPADNRQSSVIHCTPGEAGTKLLKIVDYISGDVIEGGEFEINVTQ